MFGYLIRRILGMLLLLFLLLLPLTLLMRRPGVAPPAEGALH